MASKVIPLICGALVAVVTNVSWADYSYVTVNSGGDDALNSTANNQCTLREAIAVFNKTNKPTNDDCSSIATSDAALTANEVRIPYSLAAPSILDIALTAANGAIDVSPDAPLNIKGSYYVNSTGTYQLTPTIIHPALNTDGTTFSTLTSSIFNISTTGTTVKVDISNVSLWAGRGVDGGAIKTTQTLALTMVEIKDSIASGSGAAIYSEAPSLSITRGLIYDNNSTATGASKFGAAIVQKSGLLKLNAVMVAGNTSAAGSAGVYAENANLDFNFVSLAKNTSSDASADAAGLVQTGSTTLIISNSVLADNLLPSSADSECAVDNTVTITSLFNAFSQIDATKCGIVAAEGGSVTSIVGETPLLGSLVRNETSSTAVSKIVAPYKGSALINAAAPVGHASGRGCVLDENTATINDSRDARGVIRLSSTSVDKVCQSSDANYDNCVKLHSQKSDRCDIGAIESRGAPIGIAGSLHLYRAITVDFDPSINAYVSESIPDVTTADSLQVVTQPKHGTAEVVAETASDSSISYKVRYIPNKGFEGTDSLSYSVKDYNGYDIASDISIKVDGDKKPKSGGPVGLFSLLGLGYLARRGKLKR